ncbi:MAG: pilus assembly protein [Magnetospirillum sp. WYHS-4]
MKNSAPTRRPAATSNGRAPHLWRAEDGVVGIIFALALIPLGIATGLAVDMGRAYLVEQRLNQAADAAGLALAAAMDTGQNLQTVLQTIFTANYPVTNLGTTATPSYSVNGEVITVTAQATVPMAFAQLVGINSVTVHATSQITRKQTGLEVALVLDNTGSMNSGGKIGQLRTSSKELVSTLFGNQTAPTNLKIGLVPFVTTVNIGTGNAAYVNNTHNYAPDTWKGCIEERTYPHDVLDTTTGAGGLWPTYYWPKEASSGTCNNEWTTTVDTTPINTEGPNQACPDPIVPLTNAKATLITALDNMEPWMGNGTMVNIGAVWGWRVLSSAPPFTEGVVEGTSGWKKVMIILTDGDNNLMPPTWGSCNTNTVTLDGAAPPANHNPEGVGLNSQYTGYGYAWQGRLGTSFRAAAETQLDNRLAEVCSNIKAAGITVYTITFGTTTATIQGIMQACASTTDKYYNSPTNAQLSRAFRAIAAELKKIHLSQ